MSLPCLYYDGFSSPAIDEISSFSSSNNENTSTRTEVLELSNEVDTVTRNIQDLYPKVLPSLIGDFKILSIVR
jgi:hypothetical protein